MSLSAQGDQDKSLKRLHLLHDRVNGGTMKGVSIKRNWLRCCISLVPILPEVRLRFFIFRSGSAKTNGTWISSSGFRQRKILKGYSQLSLNASIENGSTRTCVFGHEKSGCFPGQPRISQFSCWEVSNITWGGWELYRQTTADLSGHKIYGPEF